MKQQRWQRSSMRPATDDYDTDDNYDVKATVNYKYHLARTCDKAQMTALACLAYTISNPSVNSAVRYYYK